MVQSALFNDTTLAGPYRLTETLLPALLRELSPAGIRAIHIDCFAKDEMHWMQEIASALAFPTTFGMNMDALYDYLCDPQLVTRTPLMLIFQHPEHLNEEHVDILIAILQAVSDEWRETNTPLWAIFVSSQLDLDPLPIKLKIA